MPSAPYWRSPQLSYATLTLRAWSKPHACCPSCSPRRRSTCPGIVDPLPYPDAIGSCTKKTCTTC